MSLNIDKQEMRSYLLGTLITERQAVIEESILCNHEFYEELLAAEEELIDQYVTNNLSPSERHTFETHFLITAERQNKLRFGRLLRRYLNSQPVTVPSVGNRIAGRHHEVPAPAQKFFPFPGGNLSRGATLGAAAVAVAGMIVLLCICWRAIKIPENHSVQQDSSNPVTYTLTPGSLRSEGTATPRLKAPPKGINVRLDMQVSNGSFHNYKSELFRENESVQTADELKAEPKGEQQVVPWTIAGDMLSPGDYQIKLKGVVEPGQDEYIDNYTFRVVKK